MIKGKIFIVPLLLIFVLFSCKQDEFDKYERPAWLAGKVYSQIKVNEELKTFTKCLELTGYDSVIDVSGSYTVFAPTDEAFASYFGSHPRYKKVEDIPLAELKDMVKYHIVQNPWSRDQLRSLDIYGWIDPDDDYNNKPRGYKRETLLLQKNSKFGVKLYPNDKDKMMIIDTTKTSWHRIAATDSRKYAPLFYSEYFSINDLNFSDYTYYFNRTIDSPDDLFYVNAKIVGNEIFAENGFVYTIDRVVEPLPNTNEILRSTQGQYSYSKFLDLVNQFSTFEYNVKKTFEQVGADQGLQVDSLFDLTYPKLTFNITSEKTKAPAGGSGNENNSIRYQHGLIAPTNEAFDAFVDQYVKGNNQWGSLDEMPIKIKKIIANSYFSTNPVYESDVINGFFNGEDDIVRINNEDIVQKTYGSNATFLGVKKAIVPRAFKSITGPVYRQRGFSKMMNAIEYSGLVSALKREGEGNVLFAVPDSRLDIDSSLLYSAPIKATDIERFYAIMLYPTLKAYNFQQNDIRLLLLNQIAVEAPTGQARKEFLRTLAGNHLIWDNVNGIVSGTSPSKFGYLGATDVVLKPSKISTDTDNGDTYSVDSWFAFTTDAIFTRIKDRFPMFHSLLLKAKLDNGSRYSFLSDNKMYTVFAPSDMALQEIQADTLTGKNLENFLKLHFIQDEMIFTDGRKAPGYYKTTCVLPVAGSSRTENVNIYIEPGIDKITVKSKNGSSYAVVNESALTNMITARNLNIGSTVTNFPNIMSTAVVHQIDKALVFNQLDVK
jgi:uncharacterized surface protein with fasciclin (FAS1) repeats